MDAHIRFLEDELPATPPMERPVAPPVHARAAGIDDDERMALTLPVGTSLFEIERAFILATLEQFGGDKRRAAGALGCSVKTLYNKLHLYRRQHDPVAAAG